jgi:DNA-binding transcriptional LysR family regulator
VDVQQLRYLLALAAERNFTRAAARCYVSQQGFSKAIATLEKRAGTALVIRRPRGCSLTPAGQRLVTAAAAVLAQLDELHDVVEPARPASADGVSLRVGLLLDGLGMRTADVLRSYRTAVPQTGLSVHRVQPHDMTERLLDGSIDVALMHGPCDDERIHLVPLFDEQRMVVVSAADERADAPNLSAADLLTLPARPRRDGIDPTWEGFFTLIQERGGLEPQRLGQPAGSLEELLWSISLEELFLTVPAHLANTYPGAAYGVAYVPVPNLTPVTFSVAHLRGDMRLAVAVFVSVARTAVGPPT